MGISLDGSTGIGTLWHSMARVTQGASMPADLLAASKARARSLRRTWSNHVVVLLERDLAAAQTQWQQDPLPTCGTVSHIVAEKTEGTRNATGLD